MEPTRLRRAAILTAAIHTAGIGVIERRFRRLKDFRRVATRSDKLARNVPAAVPLAAPVAYWLD